MKKFKKFLFIPLFILGICAMVVMFDGCKGGGVIAPTCSDGVDDGCGNEWQACCTSVQCYYTYKGKKYQCDGTDCEAAANELVADIGDCSGIDLNTLTTGNTIADLLDVVEMIKESNLPCEDF